MAFMRGAKSKSIVYDPRLHQDDMRSQAASMISAINSATKYDLGRTVGGQAVGGPGQKTKVSMWDMITLYDTQKKKVEDREAYQEHKQQQKDLKEFYESQIEFKK